MQSPRRMRGLFGSREPLTRLEFAEPVLGRREAPIRVLILATLSHKGRGEESTALKRRREILGALQFAVAVHPAVGDIKQFRHRVVADRHRIALVA
jgi:hypothetical protein